jgi:hypothetical protein
LHFVLFHIKTDTGTNEGGTTVEMNILMIIGKKEADEGIVLTLGVVIGLEVAVAAAVGTWGT